jgi:four helix bundle protein
MSVKVLILDKSFDFSVRVVNLYKYLCNEKKEFTLSKQLLRSGTSIGANVNEAQAGQSKADFISKMSIASKEARETKYWIELLIKTYYLNIEENYVKSLLKEINELIKIITSIVKTSKENIK